MKNFVKVMLSCVVLLGFPLYFGIKGKTYEMTIMIIPSLLSVIVINLDELKKSIASIKVNEMEIKFKDVIDQAYAKIEQLKGLQYIIDEVGIATLNSIGKFGGMPYDKKLNILNEFYDNANGNSVLIEDTIREGYEVLLRDMFNRILNDISHCKEFNDFKDALKSVDNRIYLYTINFEIYEPYNMKSLISSKIELGEKKNDVDNHMAEYEKVLIEYKTRFKCKSV